MSLEFFPAAPVRYFPEIHRYTAADLPDGKHSLALLLAGYRADPLSINSAAQACNGLPTKSL